MAYNICYRFRHEYCFTGKLGEDKFKFTGNYIDACSDYDLNPTQNLRFFHNLFDREA